MLLIGLLGVQARAADAPLDATLNERVLSVPSADGPSVLLEVTVFTPDGPGPFPLAVVNHGKAIGTGQSQPRNRSPFLVRYFLSRGYAVALPMLRGFAGSQGRIEARRCGAERTGLAAARDLLAVVNFMVKEPGIDGRRIVMAGQSFGGWNTLAYGVVNDPRVKGLLNFAGGLRDPSCVWWADTLADGAANYAKKTHTPSLWLYGENDETFPHDVWQSMFDHYRGADGQAELVNVGHFVEDAHNLLGNLEGLAIWVPKVDAFLVRVGLPSQLLEARYLPPPYPTASHFAAIEDVKAVPYVGDDEAGRESYLAFLKKPLPRVYVVSPGIATSFSGGLDPLTAAMQECGKRSEHCRPYAIDNEVVWTRPTPAPPVTRFAEIGDATALPYVNAQGKQGYERFLTARKPRAFVIAPDGAWYSSSKGFDPLAAAMTICEKQHAGCRLYAVDDQVVWSEPRSGRSE